jgi:surface polysaccharide O-acyltransferase-like enzyme
MRNYGFDILRLISILGVIIMHTTSMYGVGFQIEDSDSLFRYILSYSFEWSVPIFFMISGALILSKNENPKEFYLKRLHKILLPTLFWSSVYLLIHYFVDGFSLFSLIAITIKANPSYHLWFMFAIIGLYIFTPIFRIIIHNTTKRQRYILISVVFFMSIIQNYLDTYLHNTSTIFTIFIPYIGFYFLGYELYKTKIKLSSFITIVGFFLLTIFIIILGDLFQKKFNFNGNIFASFLSPLVIAQAILLFIFLNNINYTIDNPFTQKFSSLVYGVYLIHPLFILLYINFYLTQAYPLLNIFLATLFTIPMSFIMVAILKKFKFSSFIV